MEQHLIFDRFLLRASRASDVAERRWLKTIVCATDEDSLIQRRLCKPVEMSGSERSLRSSLPAMLHVTRLSGELICRTILKGPFSRIDCTAGKKICAEVNLGFREAVYESK